MCYFTYESFSTIFSQAAQFATNDLESLMWLSTWWNSYKISLYNTAAYRVCEIGSDESSSALSEIGTYEPIYTRFFKRTSRTSSLHWLF